VVGLDTLLPWVPPGLGAAAVLVHLAVKWLKRNDAARTDEWSRMKDLLDEMRRELEQVRSRLEKAERIIARYVNRHGPLPDELSTGGIDLEDVRRHVEDQHG
jgi:hypothetical protein